MKINNLKNFQEIDKLCALWNSEYGFIFPITKELMLRNLSNAFLDASFVVTIDSEIVAFIIAKIYDDSFYIKDYEKFGWISLIYVHPKQRNKGIGTLILKKAEEALNCQNKETIYIGKDYLNFFPGLPCDLKNSLGWFEKRGYQGLYDTYDLINKCKDNKLFASENFEYRVANIYDKENLIAFINENWPGRWTKEATDYFANNGTGREYLLCLDNNKICAFAKICYPDTNINLISYSHTWRKRFNALGGIGPLGVAKTHRLRHIGKNIVCFAMNQLNDANASEMIIDWTGLLDFYRPLGFEVWKSYKYLVKKIGG